MKSPTWLALLVCFGLGYLFGARMWLILLGLAAFLMWQLWRGRSPYLLWIIWSNLRETRR